MNPIGVFVGLCLFKLFGIKVGLFNPDTIEHPKNGKIFTQDGTEIEVKETTDEDEKAFERKDE